MLGKIAVGSLAVALGVGFLWLGQQVPPDDLVQESCDPEGGTSVPFPATGSLALDAESERVKKQSPNLAKAASRPIKGTAAVWLINSGDGAMDATLFDEDGSPAARAFVRAGERAKLDVEPGAYTVWTVSGSDWTGKKFATGCSSGQAPRGVAVADRGQASLVAIAPGRGFVMGNRLDEAMARSILAQSEKKEPSREPAAREILGRERPESRERPTD